MARSEDHVPEIDPELEEDLGAQPRVEDELSSARAEAEEWRNTALRAQADFENSRKRMEGRHADALLRASERVVTELLPIVDDFERAIDHLATQDAESADGMLAVMRKLTGVLTKEGVNVIDPLGEAFDPNEQNAVQMVEDATLPDHTVTAVFQKGYAMHGRVLRSAMVVVSTGGPARAE